MAGALLDAIVVGGGIGGLSAAIALERTGANAHVYEAATELRPHGAGILVPPNALAVLARLGLARPVVDAGIAIERAELREVNGACLVALDAARFAERWQHPMTAIRRSALQEILLSALKPDALHLGKRLVDFEESGGSVRARFADQSAAEGKILIAADGIHSTVRRRLFPEISLRNAGQTCFRGLARFRLARGLEKTAREIWGGKYRFGFSAVGDGEVYWFAPVSLSRNLRLNGGDLKAKLLEAYRVFLRPVCDVIAATEPGAIIQTDLVDFVPGDRWHAGKVVLLGDAAHGATPNLGQGGAQAIEDALCLALKLRAMGFSASAFEAYERVRAPRAKKIVRLSREWGRLAHWENPFLRGARDWLIRAIGQRWQRRTLAEFFTPRV
ncbi:MAG TPA: FAD-dependent monooxygenase [Candidatus Acidoferrales bacterium]|nr:FAD-dependent monooxygenase [Candidatus Acidoferrales bacterium]